MGATVTLEIDDLAYGGAGVARCENLVVFVPGVVPGDVVRARIRKRKRAFAEADLLEVEQASAQRVAAPCAHFGRCGGCHWMNIPYASQLSFKARHVTECLTRIGRLEGFTQHAIRSSPQCLGYRNKLEFTFEKGAEGLFGGLHAAVDPGRIEEIQDCLLQPDLANRIFRWVVAECRTLGLEVACEGGTEGLLRRLIIRSAGLEAREAAGSARTETSTGLRVLVVFVTSDRPFPAGEVIARRLRDAFPDVSGVGHASVREDGSARPTEVLSGDLAVSDTIDGLTLTATAGAFLQVNPAQAVLLYRKVQEMAAIERHESALDLYCGVGAITLLLGRGAKRVVGVEASPESVRCAKHNADVNALRSCRFIQGDALRIAGHHAREGERYDLVVLNPPRAGIPEALVGVAAGLRPGRIVYVSCDPATLARDLARFARAGYRTTDVAPFDMFPQTFHVETVARLERAVSSSPAFRAPRPPESPRSGPRTSGRSRRARG